MKTQIVEGYRIPLNFPLSKSQARVAREVARENTDIVVDSKAGTGKTTLIQMLTRLILEINPNARILVMAYNEKIVSDIAPKMPSKVNTMTSHALGKAIISNFLSKRSSFPKIKKLKRYEIQYKYLTESLGWNMSDKKLKEKYSVISKLVGLCKGALVFSKQGVLDIADRYGIEIEKDEPKIILKIIELTSKDIVNIDFDDMIYLPHVIEGIDFPQFDYVFVDECQDFNIAQQELAKKCKKEFIGRLISVGDPSQAIYGFMGSDIRSFKRLQSQKNTITLLLNECFRCTKEIIKFTREQTGVDIVAHDSCPVGEPPRAFSHNDVIGGDFVMCRTTAPLVKFCFFLLARGQSANIAGRNMEENLVKIITKSKTSTIKQFYNHLDVLELKLNSSLQKSNPNLSQEEVYELRECVDQRDMHEVFMIVASQTNATTTNALSRGVSNLFSGSKDGVILSTIHKSKGLEYDRCLILEKELMPHKSARLDWEKEQENNLAYVCYTRAKKTLGWIDDWSHKSIDSKPKLFQENKNDGKLTKQGLQISI